MVGWGHSQNPQLGTPESGSDEYFRRVSFVPPAEPTIDNRAIPPQLAPFEHLRDT